jgi:hypothetical protein
LNLFGAPYALKPFNGKIVAGVNGKVSPEDQRLVSYEKRALTPAWHIG